MERPKRVLCVMDLSLAGRSSLGVVLPALAACGVQACPLPTALFSTHTGGFGPVEKQPETGFCQEALHHFKREGIGFDAVYTGYLYGQEQFALAQEVFALWPEALRVVDPALGDEGKAYSGIAEEDITRMRGLCAEANLITPNYTECLLLSGREEAPENPAGPLAKENRAVVVTSVPAANGGMQTSGCAAGGQNAFCFATPYVNQRYPGTGDLFCAALVGLLLAGRCPGLQAAAQKAAGFVQAAAKATFAAKSEPRHGVWFEPFLHLLA